MAASQGGFRIAYMTILGNDTGRQATISVITGTTARYWTAPALDGPGGTGLLGITSFAADGGELGWITVHATDAVSPVLDARRSGASRFGAAWRESGRIPAHNPPACANPSC
jgi:hypothetical protein